MIKTKRKQAGWPIRLGVFILLIFLPVTLQAGENDRTLRTVMLFEGDVKAQVPDHWVTVKQRETAISESAYFSIMKKASLGWQGGEAFLSVYHSKSGYDIAQYSNQVLFFAADTNAGNLLVEDGEVGAGHRFVHWYDNQEGQAKEVVDGFAVVGTNFVHFHGFFPVGGRPSKEEKHPRIKEFLSVIESLQIVDTPAGDRAGAEVGF